MKNKHLFLTLLLLCISTKLFSQNTTKNNRSNANASTLIIPNNKVMVSDGDFVSPDRNSKSDFKRELWVKEPFGERDFSRELVEKRDQFSKHFRNDDGTYLAHIASGPIHYQENGKWLTIFHTIEPSVNGGFQNIHNSFKSYYPANANGFIETTLPNGQVMRDMQEMRMYYEVNGQEMSSMNISGTAGKSNFNELNYLGVYGAAIDLRLTQQSTMRKMDYILKNSNALNGAPQGAQFLVFEEKVLLPDGVLAKLEDNVINLYLNGNLIAQYAKPIVNEGSTSTTNVTNGVEIEVDTPNENPKTSDEKSSLPYEGQYNIVQTGNLLTIKLKVEMVWLQDVNRVFPIEVDPTANYSPTNAVNNARSITSAGDNTIGQYVLYAGKYDLKLIYTFIDFNLSSIPTGSTVSNVSVYVYRQSIIESGYPLNSSVLRWYNSSGAFAVGNGTTGTRTNLFNSASTEYSSNMSLGSNNSWSTMTLNSTAINAAQSAIGGLYKTALRSLGTWYAHTMIVYAGYSVTNKPYVAITYCLNPTINISANPSNTICNGGSTSFNASISNAGSATINYQWKVDGINVGTNSTYQSTSLTNGQTITCEITSPDFCSAVTSSGVTIIVLSDNTVSNASSSPTLCINSGFTAITHTTSSATGISNNGVSGANGLPSGVSASWASDTITISGTPTASGTFYYTIPLTGGCGPTINATGTIIVNPNNSAGVASSSPTVDINTPLTHITHTTTYASGISNNGVSGVNGLPAGVTANFASNLITISGTPTVAGIFDYTIPLTGCGPTTNATGTIISRGIPILSNFPALTKNFYDRSFTLNPPLSDSPGAFSYVSDNTAVATISGRTITFLSPGTATITANQAQTPFYQSAAISFPLTVNGVIVTTRSGSITSTDLNYASRSGALTGKTGKNRSGQIVIASTSAEIQTLTITNLSSTTATATGSVISQGESTITARGFCWNTAPNPTIENSSTSVTGTTGPLNTTISGLSSGTTYYFRAYITNSFGTSYGNEVIFIKP